MSTIKLTPKEIRSFARSLEDLTQALRASTRALDVGFKELGRVWRDPQFRDFSKHHEQTVGELDHFLKRASAYVTFLKEKAARGEKAAGHRF